MDVDPRAQYLYDLLEKETDRGCAIVGAQMIDDALGELVLACLGDSKAARDNLVAGGLAPLKSFSARQKLALHLGLITEHENADVEDVRWIRNKAAHVVGSDVEPWDELFAVSEVAQRCHRFQFFDHTVNRDLWRRRYCIVATSYSALFEAIAADLRKLDVESGARVIAAVESRVRRRASHLEALAAAADMRARGLMPG